MHVEINSSTIMKTEKVSLFEKVSTIKFLTIIWHGINLLNFRGAMPCRLYMWLCYCMESWLLVKLQCLVT